ncbi:MAG: hypothetical protein KAI27_06845 [Rhodospirillaceae bacterium]|nr:hypothetical protein [Rhodospirillaceae bacterium]
MSYKKIANQTRFLSTDGTSILGKLGKTASIMLVIGALGACSQGSVLSSNASEPQMGPDGQPAAPEKSFNRFPDIPVPTNAKMDTKRTLVFGSGESWYGQLGLNAKHDGDTIFDFYKQELPGFGWEEITSVRAQVSMLTYMRGERVASIQIEKGNISGSSVTFTVSPRGGAIPK